MPLLETAGSSAVRAYGLTANSAYAEALPTSIANLYAWYTPENLASNGTTWTDASGNGRSATISGGTKSKVLLPATLGASKPKFALDFDASTTIYWGNGMTISNAGNYTIFHVARYKEGTGASTGAGRFFHAAKSGVSGAPNWLSGFWSACAGTQYHEGWITFNGVGVDPINRFDKNWVLSTDQHNFYKANGTIWGNGGNATANTYSFTHGMVTNDSYEPSTGYISEVLMYSRNLNSTERLLIEGYLANKHGISIG
jgi:hypothetical protein